LREHGRISNRHSFNLSGDGELFVWGRRVGHLRICHTLQIKAALGRVFFPARRSPDKYARDIISDSLWKRRFGIRFQVLAKKFSSMGRELTRSSE